MFTRFAAGLERVDVTAGGDDADLAFVHLIEEERNSGEAHIDLPGHRLS
jgi:hypothetical protein